MLSHSCRGRIADAHDPCRPIDRCFLHRSNEVSVKHFLRERLVRSEGRFVNDMMNDCYQWRAAARCKGSGGPAIRKNDVGCRLRSNWCEPGGILVMMGDQVQIHLVTQLSQTFGQGFGINLRPRPGLYCRHPQAHKFTVQLKLFNAMAADCRLLLWLLPH